MAVTVHAMPEHEVAAGFAARLRDHGHALYRVQTIDAAGRACWFLMQLSLTQRIRLQQTTADAMVDLQQYGVILDAGWGIEGRAEGF